MKYIYIHTYIHVSYLTNYFFISRFTNVVSIREDPIKKNKRKHPTGDRKRFLDNWLKRKKAEEAGRPKPKLISRDSKPPGKGKRGKGKATKEKVRTRQHILKNCISLIKFIKR